MAKLPDGHIFFLKENRKKLCIDIERRELIMCRNCEQYKEWEDTMICMRLGSYYGNTKPTDYCSYAWKKETKRDGQTD